MEKYLKYLKGNAKQILIIIGVIFLVGIGITAAYYTIGVNGNPSENNIAIGAGTVSLEFSDGNSTINVQNVLPGWSETKTFSVTNTSTADDVELEYQILLIVTTNEFPSSSFKYSLTGTGEGALTKSDTDITSNSVVMGSANITGTGTVHNYTFTLTYKNLTTDQSSEMGSVLTGYVTIEATSNVSKKLLLSNTIMSTAGTTDGLYNYGTAGYRYSGKTPNNYITFNEETWRIIGFIDGSQIGKEAGTYYTKIIRNESIGDKRWNSTEANTWYTSSLYSELNSTSAYTGNANIEAVDWHHTAQSSTSVLTSAMYTNEGWGTTCSTSSKNCTKSAKVGIMSPSDYGYGSNSCYSSTFLGLYSDNACKNSNWLFLDPTEWLLMPNASRSRDAFAVPSDGKVGLFNVTGSYTVRPVVYLKSTTTVTGGDGKVGSPYTYE